MLENLPVLSVKCDRIGSILVADKRIVSATDDSVSKMRLI